MKNIKNILAAVLMVVVLMVGTSFAKGGLLMSDFGGNQSTCSTTDTERGGIIVAARTGIIVAARTGILVAGRTGADGLTGIIVVFLTGNSETTRNQTVCGQ